MYAKPIQHEAMEQESLFEWAKLMGWRYPELELLYHIPNGGSRNPAEAAHLKKQGVKAGVPDLCLPVARGRYHGLYIELKYGKNTPSDDQEKWMLALSKQGYAVKVCYGWEQARKSIMKYLEMEKK